MDYIGISSDQKFLVYYPTLLLIFGRVLQPSSLLGSIKLYYVESSLAYTLAIGLIKRWISSGCVVWFLWVFNV